MTEFVNLKSSSALSLYILFFYLLVLFFTVYIFFFSESSFCWLCLPFQIIESNEAKLKQSKSKAQPSLIYRFPFMKDFPLKINEFFFFFQFDKSKTLIDLSKVFNRNKPIGITKYNFGSHQLKCDLTQLHSNLQGNVLVNKNLVLLQ